MHTSPTQHRTTRRGFTLIEMLVVAAIIVILAGIILVAVGRTLGTARRTAIAAKLGTINQAVAVFERELGYAPPLITPQSADWTLGADAYPTTANAFTVPQTRFLESSPGLGLNPDQFRRAMARARYASEFSLTVYLMGIGDLYQGSGNELSGIEDDGVAGPGIANPGRDRSWGGARDRGDQQAVPGPALGPYLDPGQFADSLELVEFAGGLGGGGPRGLYRLIDSYDHPIRYYTGWPSRMPDAANAPAGFASAGQLTGLYTPPELRSLESWQRFVANPTDQPDAGLPPGSLDNELASAKWALLSAGAPGEDADPTVSQAESAARENRFYIAPFGDAANINGAKRLFEMFPLSNPQAEIDAFESAFALDRLRRGIETNIREIGR